MTAVNTDSLMEITKRPPFNMVEGSGSWLTDENGKKYVDFVQGWAVNCLGHCSPVMIEALEHQSKKLINCSPAFFNEPMSELAALIAKLSGLEKIFFTNSGAEANEGAIKLARKWGQKNKNGAFEIITMENSFHGRTLATMSASGKPHWKELFEPKVPGFVKVPINNIDSVKAAITDRTVAIMLEPIQGEGGVIPADIAFLKALREVASKNNILLIFDEIQTGIGRTGTVFAFEHAGVTPDILTLGKGLGGGVPLAGMVAKETVCCFEHGDQGGTYNGNPLMTAVGLAVLQEISKPSFLKRVNEASTYFRSQLEALSKEFQLGEVRGSGLLLALATGEVNASDVVSAALEKGALINAPNPTCLRFMSSLNVTNEEIDKVVDIIRTSLKELVKTKVASQG